MRALASRLLGDRYQQAVLPLVFPVRQHVASKSAWRVEGTFREYPQARPTNCWFSYPRHLLDADGVLQDANPPGDEPPWKRGGTATKARTGSRALDKKLKLEAAFNTLQEGGEAKVLRVAEYLDREYRTVSEWLKASEEWTVSRGVMTRKNSTQNKGHDDDNDSF